MKPMNLNRVYLAGNLTRDPVMRKTATGLAVADLSVASNEERTDKSGKTVKQTCFVEAAVWGKQAEACCASLKKGAPVLLEGKLQFQQWETKEGQKRNRLVIQTDRVHVMNPAGQPAATEDVGDAPDLDPGF